MVTSRSHTGPDITSPPPIQGSKYRITRKKSGESYFLPPGHNHYTIDAIVIDIGVSIVSIIGININVVEIVVVIVDIVVDIHHECYNRSNEVDKVEGIRAS